jgi:ribonuclease PH
MAFQHMRELGALKSIPLTDQVAAVSCGLVKGQPSLDLDYDEDSAAEADANFVITGRGRLVEVQATAERGTFERRQLDQLLDLATAGVAALCQRQRDALGL